MTSRPAPPSVPSGHELRVADSARLVGWYRDPEHPLAHRYWTGEQWVDDPSVTFPPEPRDPVA